MSTEYGLSLCIVSKKAYQLTKKVINPHKKKVTISGIEIIRTMIIYYVGNKNTSIGDIVEEVVLLILGPKDS